MKSIGPYAEIEKAPLFASDSMRSRGYSVRLAAPQASAGWREVGLVSADYLLVPNRQVRDMALEIATQTQMDWKETKVVFDGKRFVYTLIAEPKVYAEVRVG